MVKIRKLASIEKGLEEIIKVLSEDDNSNFEKKIQKLTDNYVENIEKILLEKEKEISQV